MKLNFLFLFSIGLIMAGCAPKTIGNTVTAPVEKASDEPDAVSTNPECVTFSNSKLPDDAINAHAVYRTFLRSNDLAAAFPHWQKAFELAPAADGKRAFQYTDGVRFYKDFYSKSENADEKAGFVKKIRELYDAATYCYPKEYYLYGLQAFDLYYSFREYTTDTEIYELFKKTIDLDGERTAAFVLNPFTDILIKRFNAGEINLQEARHYAEKVRTILAYGLNTSKEKESFLIVESYAPVRLEEFETTEDFYSPSYYLDRYYPDYLADSTNCDVVQTVYSRLRYGKVDVTDARLVMLEEKMNNECKVEETASTARTALAALQAGRYREAIKGFEQAADETDDIERKAKYNQLIAKIYYAHLKSFGNARTYAQKAAKLQPNWGEPAILIGKLYASSGPLCGPGRGWDSQVVTWAAIDKWQYAKSIDPSVSNEATKLINQYSAFMPSVEDIFQRNLQEGQTYTIGCWIQETTRIRASK